MQNENSVEVQAEKLTEEQALEKLKALYRLVFDIELDIKDVMDECKKVNLDGPMLKKLAKASVYCTLSNLESKCRETLKKILELDS